MRLIATLFALLFSGLMVGGVLLVVLFYHYDKDLPDYSQLAKYDPATVTRLYAADGKLMAEYAREKRVYVPLSAMPKRLIQAFLSAEDQNFYSHPGVDFMGIVRAAATNFSNLGRGKSLVGGSTITQQVVKNFLLTNEKSIDRKIKEAILAFRISKVYSKDRILELYLNEIYLGEGSYGVAAASLDYFNKSMDELSIEESAFLAALPKAPANYDPQVHYERAKGRRDWVINRMFIDGYITDEEAKQASLMPITLRVRDDAETTRADFFAEEVRRELAAMYGSNVLYGGGLYVKTSLTPDIQQVADHALQDALINYDKRWGYRGPLHHLASVENWLEELRAYPKDKIQLIRNQQLAVVLMLSADKVIVGLENGERATVPFELMKWARKDLGDLSMGSMPSKPSDVLSKGDIIIVGKSEKEENIYALAQVPEVNGALVVMDPHTGRVLALSGGYTYGSTEFNRATQALRQPGSAFKPFVYLSGMESGYTPASIVLDAPVEMSQGAGLPMWRPQNYHDDYLGPTTLRMGLEKSRNTMTVRLAQMIGIDKIISVSERLHVYKNPLRNFSMVLGATETTLIRLTNAYAMLVNGGKRVDPALIERIDDRYGKTIYRRDNRPCLNCKVESDSLVADVTPPIPADDRETVVDPRVAYQMVSMLQGVVDRGTGHAAAVIGKPLGGKTGTTNESYDTWFVGFSPDLVTGVYIGYDRPHSLGKRETGASVALPAFIEVMSKALEHKPSTPFRIPPGVQLTRVDRSTGLPAQFDTPSGQVILESFVTGDPIYIPADPEDAGGQNTSDQPTSPMYLPPPAVDSGMPSGDNSLPGLDNVPAVGTGGLY